MARAVKLFLTAATGLFIKIGDFQNVAPAHGMGKVTRPCSSVTRGFSHLDGPMIVSSAFGSGALKNNRTKVLPLRLSGHQLQVELGGCFRSPGLGIINGLGDAAFFLVLARRDATVHEAHVAAAFGSELQMVFVALERQGLVARADKNSRRFEPVEQAAGFFPYIVDPFAEVGAHRTLALALQPDIVGMSNVDQRQDAELR